MADVGLEFRRASAVLRQRTRMLIDSEYQREVVVAGERIVLRCIRASDKEALNAFFQGLHPETRYKRFLAYMGELSQPMLRYLTELDLNEHLAIVAIGETGALVGVTRMVRFSTNRTRAEMAIVVGDAHQQRGLGAILVDMLAEASRERGVETFVAHALSDNVAIRRSLARLGPLVSNTPGILQVALGTPARVALPWTPSEVHASPPPSRQPTAAH